jgi:hypothetical protein
LDNHAYTHLVRRLEIDSNIGPSAFRTKVALISVAAYVALFGVLAAVAALLYFGFTSARAHHSTSNTIRIAIAAAAMLPIFFVVLRFFFMRLPAPEGRSVSRKEAPKLFETLDKMRAKLNGPLIHHVVIDDEYNAAIAQVPRFGLFGRHTNYLILGLPYLLGVSPKEMFATIAHEYGHLCGNHGKFGAWVYRQRRVFGALHDQVQHSAQNGAFDAMLNGALARFMPYYNAYTFVLSRQDEYEADRTATALVGATANASGLIRDALLGKWIHQEFWPRLFRQADLAMRPSFMPFHAMKTAFKASYEQWATKEGLKAAWMQKSDLHDTHPCLRDRVEATGEVPTLPPCVEITAAEALMGGPFTKILIDEFDQRWWSRQRPEWEARCKYATRSRSRLKELTSKPLEQLPIQDLQEYAFLTAEFASESAAKPILEHLLKQPSGPFPRASFIYGRILLSEDNPRGLDYLETAATNDRQAIEDAAHIGFYYLLRKEGEYSAEKWWNKIWSLAEE